MLVVLMAEGTNILDKITVLKVTSMNFLLVTYDKKNGIQLSWLGSVKLSLASTNHQKVAG